MSTDRVEGSVWHPQSDMAERADSDESMSAARFSQLMSQAAAGVGNLGNRRLACHRRSQRYRLVGGPAEGVVCEVGERDGEVCLRVLVPHYQLFTTLTQLSSWLSARLRASGHSLVLAVEYVEHGASIEQETREEHVEHDESAQHSCRGMSFGETPPSGRCDPQ